jgi:hypothetical protein
MSTKSILLALLLGLTLGTTAMAQNDVRVERVQFEPGTSQATIEDRIQGYEVVRYLLGARAGQTMEVTLETFHGATYFNVLPPGYEPGRDAATFRGEVDGNHYEETLSADGDNMIEVYMMRSAARRDEVANYALTAKIEGTPQGPSQAVERGPWPVDTDASGDLPCTIGGASFERDAFDLQCPFRVKRNPYGATIWTVKPGEKRPPSALAFEDLRTLYFESDAFSTDDGSEIFWDQYEDTWVVKVGDGERYWIPSAVITGG